MTKVDFCERPFKVWVDDTLYLAKTVIVATGARANYLGLPSEDALKNKGVSACAVCDGALFRNQAVVVVGGGDTAMEEATYLTALRSASRSSTGATSCARARSCRSRACGTPRSASCTPRGRRGARDEQGVTGVRVRDLKNGGMRARGRRPVRRDRPHADHRPVRPARHERQGLPQDRAGHDAHEHPRRLRRGDAMDRSRQAVTAAGTGCMAALDAERWLAANE